MPSIFHRLGYAGLFVLCCLFVGLPAAGCQVSPGTGTSPLKVQYATGDVSPSNSDIKPNLVIVNTGPSAVPLAELTIRYWYTRDSDRQQQYWCDYAVVDCATITTSFGGVDPQATGVDTYLELGFTAAAGSLEPGHDSGVIQSRITKIDWGDFNEADDYSYAATQTVLADWNKVTLYQNGVLVWGTEPGGTVTSTLKVQYRTGDVSPTNSDIKPDFVIVNTGTAEVQLFELKIRYWYTNESRETQRYWCDYALLDCEHIVGTFGEVYPAIGGVDSYLELRFKGGAGSLPGGSDTGPIQSRITTLGWSDFNEANDYSYDPTQTTLADWDKVTLYLNNVVIWGMEPGGCGGPYPGPECPTHTPTPLPTPTITPIMLEPFLPI